MGTWACHLTLPKTRLVAFGVIFLLLAHLNVEIMLEKFAVLCTVRTRLTGFFFPCKVKLGIITINSLLSHSVFQGEEILDEKLAIAMRSVWHCAVMTRLPSREDTRNAKPRYGLASETVFSATLHPSPVLYKGSTIILHSPRTTGAVQLRRHLNSVSFFPGLSSSPG